MDPTDTDGGNDERRVRIGDTEREEVLNALQEHLAAGRLTVEEYEERAAKAVAARYADDLDDLLTDLPPTEAEQAEQAERERAWGPPNWQGRLPFPVPLMIGLAVLVIIALPGPPFLLFPLLWVGLFFAFARLWRGRGGDWSRGWCDHDHKARFDHRQGRRAQSDRVVV